MSGANSTASSGGLGFFGALALLFVALKLTGNIDWSWWAVTSPLWGPLAATLGFIAAYVFVSAIWHFVLEPAVNWWRRK